MNLIEIGQIVNTHGIKGEVKVNPWVDSLDEFYDFKSYYYKKNEEYIKLNKQSLRFHKNCAILKFKEIADLTEAEKYKGIVLFSEKNENLPSGTYYVEDLIGLKVFENETEIGTISEVFKTGANDVYEVVTPENKKYYIPAIKDVIKDIDIKNKTMQINIIDGLLD